MPENVPNPPQLSVHIMLPEAINRRLERWSHKMEGASWPAWGGHVTLVPNFVETGNPGAARAAIAAVCAKEMPFAVRFGAPQALPDSTRPDYYIVLLTVEAVTNAAPSASPPVFSAAPVPVEGEVMPEEPHIHALRQRLLDATKPYRMDVRPQLVEQKFLPHITLALGLGETEAHRIVREMRAEPINAEFRVEVVWLVTQTFGENGRFERHPIPLGQVPAVELLRD